MPDRQQIQIGKTRALMTEREREQITGQEGQNSKYQATSRIRRRIKEELTIDIEMLAEYHPDLLTELREVACDEQ